jgi:hypothetical protein
VLPNNVTGGGLFTVGRRVKILISGVSGDKGLGGRGGGAANLPVREVGNDTTEPCGELVGVAMDACMAVSGSLITVVVFDVADSMLAKLLKLEPEQCLLSFVGALCDGITTRLAKHGKANVQASIAATVTWHCVAMTYGRLAAVDL